MNYRLTGAELSVEDIAVTEQEAYGIIEGNPFVISEQTGELELYDANAIPLYRLQHITGAAADGMESIVIAAPDTTHYCTVEPPILAKQRTSLSGELSNASAMGLSSIKSPAIEAIQQVNYDPNRSYQEQQDILKPWEYPDYDEQTEQPKASVQEQVDDAAINKLIDKLFTGDYLDKLCAKMAEHGLAVSHTTATLGSKIEGKQKTGPTTDPAYGLPPSIELTDPVSGKVTTYYASTSFITQEPDGSILICDGYGSEIRMSRGNIYISPALDLFMRPGRDMSAMVPRHQSFNAQGYTTINSAKSAYIRAAKDLKMVGATDGEGMVTLESEAKDTGSISNGMLIKCKSGSAIVANNIYLGRNSGGSVANNKVNTPATEGTIIIDACSNGIITARSARHMTDTGSLYMLASNANAASAIRLDPSNGGVYTNSIELPANVSMIGKKAQEKVAVMRDGMIRELTLTTVSGAPQLVVEGNTLIGGILMCNGAGHFSGAISANGVMSNAPTCAVLDTTYGDPFKKTPIERLTANTIGASVAGMEVNASQYLYQDVYVAVNGFSFPVDYGVNPQLRVPGMMWQTVDRDGARIWEEKDVKSLNKAGETVATMCYPGKAVWDNAKVSITGYTTTNLKDGYTTNTPKGAI
jgi:hypothetical protein